VCVVYIYVYDFGVSSYTLDCFSARDHRFFSSVGGSTFVAERFRITDAGLHFQTGFWHKSLDGNQRLYFASNSTTYIQGNGSGDVIEFRNGNDALLSRITCVGQFSAHFRTIASLNTDHVGVIGNTAMDALGYYFLHIFHNTFTGFHRCYTDDELFNEDEVDILKNNYMGRIVTSKCRIKPTPLKVDES
jgi:hypothetical protein